MSDDSASGTLASERKARILDEAAASFNEIGYFDTRLEDIAERIGAAKTLISYHYRSKETLLAEAYERSLAFAEDELRDAARARDGLERAVGWVRGHAYAHANAAFGRRAPLALVADLQALGDGDRAELSARYELQIREVRNFLREGVEDGSVAVASVEAATFFIFSIVHWLPRWLQNVPPQRQDDAVDGLCDLMRYGLATDRSRAPAALPALDGAEAFPEIFDRDTRNRLKREAFLRAGTRFLNRKGFRSLSLNEVAAELGVTRGAFYYYIKDKEDLLERCFDRSFGLIEKSMHGSGPDALATLEASVRRLFQSHSTDLDPLVRTSLVHALPAAKKRAAAARMNKIAATYSEILADGMVDGSVRPIDLEAAEQLVLGAVFAASRRRLAHTGLETTWRPCESPVAASAVYFEPLIRGLARRPAV